MARISLTSCFAVCISINYILQIDYTYGSNEKREIFINIFIYFYAALARFPIQLTGIKTKEKSIGQDQQDRQDAI